jgi:hypothetical protein
MTFHLTDRRTGLDLAQTFSSAQDAGAHLATLGQDAQHYDITARRTRAGIKYTAYVRHGAR